MINIFSFSHLIEPKKIFKPVIKNYSKTIAGLDFMSVSADKYEALRFRLMVIERLKLLKRMFSYKELSSITGVPETVLCRYIKGSIIPSYDQAERIWHALNKMVDIRKLILEKLEVIGEGFVDLSQIISDPYMLQYIAQHVYMLFAGKRVTKVLAPAVNGIPFATAIALTFQVPLVIARRTRNINVVDYIEGSYIGPSADIITFYVPKRMIKRKDEVLIVDDIVRTGKTLRTMVKIVERVKAIISGAVILVGIGEAWKKEINIPVDVIVQLPEALK